MNLSAIIMMIIMLGGFWGGFSYMIYRTMKSE
ncbi:MAG TPA: MetS family NSS transporter small subunit [Bacillus sp. (in: firmicutes)]|nr:MetS family NSS transporter small subunit [Bacillus sp. (in: firmicutes)]